MARARFLPFQLPTAAFLLLSSSYLALRPGSWHPYTPIPFRYVPEGYETTINIHIFHPFRLSIITEQLRKQPEARSPLDNTGPRGVSQSMARCLISPIRPRLDE